MNGDAVAEYGIDHPARKLVPAEQPQTQEGGLQEERRHPSIASGAPKTLPTSLEYDDQFIPKWNSCIRPVTTPKATLMTSRVPKNLVSRRYSGVVGHARLPSDGLIVQRLH